MALLKGIQGMKSEEMRLERYTGVWTLNMYALATTEAFQRFDLPPFEIETTSGPKVYYLSVFPRGRFNKDEGNNSNK